MDEGGAVRSGYPFLSMLSRSSPWVSLCLSAGVYLLLWKLVPYTLRGVPMLAPLSRLAVTAAPLMAAVFLLPLPVALWRASRERRLVRKMVSIETLRAMRWDELEMVVRRLFEQHGMPPNAWAAPGRTAASTSSCARRDERCWCSASNGTRGR